MSVNPNQHYPFICEETGREPIMGVCPIHNGDACILRADIALQRLHNRLTFTGQQRDSLQDSYERMLPIVEAAERVYNAPTDDIYVLRDLDRAVANYYKSQRM